MAKKALLRKIINLQSLPLLEKGTSKQIIYMRGANTVCTVLILELSMFIFRIIDRGYSGNVYFKEKCFLVVVP